MSASAAFRSTARCLPVEPAAGVLHRNSKNSKRRQCRDGNLYRPCCTSHQGVYCKLRTPRMKSFLLVLKLYDVVDGPDDVFGLGQDGIFEFRLVGTESVRCGNATHRSVEFFEELISDSRGDFGAITPGARIFVCDNHSICFAHACSNCIPVVRTKGSKIHNLHRDSLPAQLRRSNFGAMHDRSISDDADIAALAHDPRLAERNGEIFAGIKRSVIGLAVKVLVLEE